MVWEISQLLTNFGKDSLIKYFIDQLVNYRIIYSEVRGKKLFFSK